jgi:hypothetical protein
MKKNYLKLGIGLAVGSALLITSTFVSLANGTDGYELLKESFKNSKGFDNATINAEFTVIDNDEKVLDVSGILKADHENEIGNGSVSLKSDSISSEFDFYAEDNSVVVKRDGIDTYFKFISDDESEEYSNKHEKFGENQELSKEVSDLHEKIFDTLVGDIKKQIVEKDLTNGDKEISLELNENQIPEIVNAVLSAKHDDDSEYDENEKICGEYLEEVFGISCDDFKVNELEKDIKVKNIYLETVLDKDNEVKGIGFSIKVSGKDENNDEHVQTVTANLNFSDINSTTVETIDLTDKEVEEILKDDLKVDLEK